MKTSYKVSVNSSRERIHMTVEREDGKPVRCGWDTLQKLKDEYVGEWACLVEFFPPKDDVVNEINRRHFWSTCDLPPLSHGYALPFEKKSPDTNFDVDNRTSI